MTSALTFRVAVLVAGLLLAFGAPARAQETLPLTAADYTGADNIADVQISPDGSRIAYIGRGEGSARTIVIMTIGEENDPLIVRPSPSGGLTHLRFLTNTHLWLQLGEHEVRGNQLSLVSSYVLNSETRQFQTMPRGARLALVRATGDRRVRVWANTDNPQSRGFMERQMSGIGFALQSIALDDAEDVRTIIRSNGYLYWLDASGRAAVRLRPADRRRETVDLWARTSGEAVADSRDDGWHSRFSEVPAVAGSLRFDGRSWDETSPVFDRVGGLGDRGRSLYFATRIHPLTREHLPGRRRAVFRFNVETGAFEGPVVQSAVADVEDFIVDWRTNEVVGVRWHERRGHTSWFEPQLAAIQSALDARFPEHDVSLTSWDDAGERFIVRLDGGGSSGRYFLFDLAGEDLTLLGAIRPSVPDDRVHPVQTVDYLTADGLEQFAYLTTPRDRVAESLPLVLLAHQGPGYRDRGGFDPWAQYLAAEGYAVLQPQYRGSTGFGADFAELSRGAWGGAMSQDLDDALDHVIATGLVDADRVCLMGGDYGGLAALLGAIRTPDRFRCAIAAEPIVSMELHVRNMRRSSVRVEQRFWAERAGGDDSYDRDQLRASSPVRLVHADTPPLMVFPGVFSMALLRGDDDGMDDFKEAIRELGITRRVSSVMAPPGWWQGGSLGPSPDIMERVRRFLVRHNPPSVVEP